jgi:alpha/beta superfamily hydrolase
VRLVPVTLPGPAGTLEALLQENEARRHALTAVVCHPHPSYGGTMHNKVVHRLAQVLHARGAAVLRFNFRGVGQSEGGFDGGRGETEDARAALAFMRERYPGARRWVGGFSFGSWIASRLAAAERDVDLLVLIAPPVRKSDFAMLHHGTLAKVVIQGTSDKTCPPEDLDREFPLWAEPKTLVRVEGATHFFDKQLADLAKALDQALPPAPQEAPS